MKEQLKWRLVGPLEPWQGPWRGRQLEIGTVAVELQVLAQLWALRQVRLDVVGGAVGAIAGAISILLKAFTGFSFIDGTFGTT